MEFVLHPIGVIRSPFNDPATTPFQPVFSQAIGQVEVFDKYVEGLSDVSEMSHLFLLYVFDRSSGFSLRVKPFLDNQVRGVFATRYPKRPNPIGISLVQLLAVEGNRLTVQGIDVFDGTPLLDIKPFVPDFDIRESGPSGWYDRRAIKE